MGGEESRTGSKHTLVTGPGAVTTAVDAEVQAASNVLGVAYETDAEEWLGRFQAGPDRVAVVSVGEHSRSAATASSSPDAGTGVVASATGAVETIPDGEDVAAVGVLVNDYLSAWEGTDTTVVVDDLAAVLEYVSGETAFRFVHALLSAASSKDASVVAGFDTADQPPHVVTTFAELFDERREGA